ncbi:DUF3014 domain-containing protein [Colwellia psychrerythraea]|uniref:DUF3014 domain-containing protein n=1 Tax=Colwellia psychrerythraea TaxID=28229 RepID=A0A099L0D3_COLPS|nr:DUF3014 domain-containing protein [Colwellia psychrerythraea]KGJ96331.1 Protein of unknown function DUF3014 [Colwellia psychrerythraea]
MDNSEATQPVEQGENEKKSGPLIIFIVTLVLVAVALWQFSGGKTEKRAIDTSELLKQEPLELVTKSIEVVEEGNKVAEVSPEVLVIEESELAIEEVVVEPVVIAPLPVLDESDSWVQGKLPEFTWRNELLSLLITEDIIRRFVVFTDNFAQGLLAYEHSPFVQPKVKFSVDEQAVNLDGEQNVWQWNSETSKRFDLYVDLLRSLDSSTLVNGYFEAKPLIDEAYSELGYDEDFTFALQDAITRVLDMELPKSALDITRTSVMYKYNDPQLEALDDSDKLLLRIGKENLLIIKSVLLEVNEKLAYKMNEQS